MTWTRFMDMHSGGGLKESPYEKIYIEAPEEEAQIIFYNRFGHNPNRVSCTCCGSDYSIDDAPSLARASGYDRNCSSLVTPKDKDGRFHKPEDPWFDEHYWIEPEEASEALERGYQVEEASILKYARQYGEESRHRYYTVEEYKMLPNVLIIPKGDIATTERQGDIPDQGYVWVG